MSNTFRKYVPVVLSDRQAIYTDLILDTGAAITVIQSQLQPGVLQFKALCAPHSITGVNGTPFMVVARDVLRLYVAGLCLGRQTVWTTDDPEVKNSVLGMDILSQLNFAYFSKDREFRVKPGTYNPDSVIDYANRRSALYFYLASIMRAHKYDDLLDYFKSDYRATYAQFIAHVNKLLQQQ